MKLFSSKRRVIAALAVVLLLLFLLRPGASKLKSRIAGSIGAALGRQVEIGSVHMRLLPRPGFDLENLVVYDDPAFGAEPMLRAGEVTASLRLISLARGRIEIARLELTEPSLNLVQANGRWNLEALLERTAHTPLAPTAKPKTEARPGFPYIAADSARINFKIGQEKKPYALTGADFALWQDSENAWGVRLKAQPFRSDLNLSDTGTLRVDGTWQRASSLRDTPLQFSLEWNRPQLGQLTKFLTGNDKGWRGAVQLDATFTGTPGKLRMVSDASVRDFRRYDIGSGDALTVAAHCEGQYSTADHDIRELFCRGPVGSGAVTVRGTMDLLERHNYDLAVTMEHVPASSVAALIQRAKKNLPSDLVALGTVEGSFSMREGKTLGEAPRWEGRGEIANLQLASASNKSEFAPVTIPLVLNSGDSAETKHRKESRRVERPSYAAKNQPHLEFGPFPVATGRTTPALARGWVSRSGYNISLVGETEVARALRAARMIGLAALGATAEGAAQVELQVTGAWAGFAQPLVVGRAKLRNVRAELRGVDGPIEISSADLQLSPDRARVTKLSANAAHALWTGSLELARGCGTPGACAIQFNLNANEIDFNELSQWISPRTKEKPWYRMLSPTAQTGPSFLASVQASGKLTANRLLIHSLAATHVSANVNLDNGKLAISELRADFLNGRHEGEWQADFTVKPPAYSGSGMWTGVSLGPLAAAMKDAWISGTASGRYEIKASGDAEEFWKSAEGTIQFDMRNGVLPHISLVSDAGPLRVDRFQGRARLQAGKFEIKDGTLDGNGDRFQVNGTATLGRVLDLQLSRRESGATRPAVRAYSITGTVAEPRIAPVVSPQTQAQLKR